VSPKVKKSRPHPSALLEALPRYTTKHGAAYVGNSLDLLKALPSRSVSAIITSPPYALKFKKAYGNEDPEAYVDWFMTFAPEFRRVLKPNGSLVLEIGGAWNPGVPTRSVYHFDLLVRLVREQQFHLAEEFFWFNRARIPGPTEWVNVRRIRVKDAVTPIWWLSPSTTPEANNRRVLTPYSKQMQRLFVNGYNHGFRPSGHVAKQFENKNRGAIPPNLLQIAHTSSNDGYQEYCRRLELTPHPARFPRQVPEFFAKFLTSKNDLILDPFAGSNMTGFVAEQIGRPWLAFELRREYVSGSLGRFLADPEMKSGVKRESRLRAEAKKRTRRS
jgi:site-specific DNA-methyltransferase (cytosine-N4-specific)